MKRMARVATLVEGSHCWYLGRAYAVALRKMDVSKSPDSNVGVEELVKCGYLVFL